jgi:nicotinamidase-related amidase
MTTSQTALLLLDLQNEMVDPNGKIGAGGLAKVVAERGVLDKAAKALAAARNAGVPVVFVRLGFRPDYSDALSVAPRVEKLKANKAAMLGTWGTEFPESIQPARRSSSSRSNASIRSTIPACSTGCWRAASRRS